MKTTAALVLISVVSATAFIPVHKPTSTYHQATSLFAKAAKSKEEDLELTRKVIADFIGGDEDDGSEASSPAASSEESAEKKGKNGKKSK